MKAIVVLPTPPLGANIGEDAGGGDVRTCRELLAHTRDPRHQVEPGEGHRQDPVDALGRVQRDGVLGHGQDDDRHAQMSRLDLLDELQVP
ncbi:MAG: hypothetical protein WKF78_13650 [Candidatus Limnocylindrales bacterium]